MSTLITCVNIPLRPTLYDIVHPEANQIQKKIQHQKRKTLSPLKNIPKLNLSKDHVIEIPIIKSNRKKTVLDSITNNEQTPGKIRRRFFQHTQSWKNHIETKQALNGIIAKISNSGFMPKPINIVEFIKPKQEIEINLSETKSPNTKRTPNLTFSPKAETPKSRRMSKFENAKSPINQQQNVNFSDFFNNSHEETQDCSGYAKPFKIANKFNKHRTPKMIRITRKSASKSPQGYQNRIVRTEMDEDGLDKDDYMLYRAILNADEDALDSRLLEKKDDGANTARYTRAEDIYNYEDKKPDKLKSSAPLTMIKTSFDKQQFPRQFGIIKKENQESIKWKLGHFKAGDRYADVIAQALERMPNLTQLDLQDNGITEKGAEEIAIYLSKGVKKINLMQNNLRSHGTKILNESIQSRNIRIEYLNLENNKIGDQGAKFIFEGFREHYYLKKLNLSSNGLTAESMQGLSELLERNDMLAELYLHNNKIDSTGGCTLFEGLQNNKVLKVLDMSWNILGSGIDDIGESFFELFSKNSTLIHCDFSFNKIQGEETKRAAEGLVDNQTLYGLHWKGNMGYLDGEGQLIAIEQLTQEHLDVKEAVTKIRIDGVKCLRDVTFQEKLALENCWICEGWKEVVIKYTPGVSGNIFDAPIFVHMDFNKFNGTELKQNENGQFEISTVVPPGERKYFFSHNEKGQIAQDQPITDATIDAKNAQSGEKRVSVQLSQANFCVAKLNEIVSEDYEISLTTKPRIKRQNTKVQQETPWNFKESAFKDYKKEDDEHVNKCFLFDWEQTRIARIVKEFAEQELIQEILQKHYRALKDVYKYFSALGIAGEVFSITINAFTEFLNQAGLLEGSSLTLSEVDILFYTANAVTSKQNFNPDRALVRYQFLEILVRLAMDKYYKPKLVQRPSEAVALIIDEISKFLKLFNLKAWREMRYWNKECDNVFKIYMPIVKDLFNTYSERSKPGKKRYVTLEEMKRMCQDAELFVENFQEREVAICFNNSMMLQVDEINSDKHLQMVFVEFIEALGRIAEKLSIVPYNETINKKDTYSKRYSLPLWIKIEGLIGKLYQKNCSFEFQKQFSLPEESIFKDLNEYLVENKETQE